MSQVRALLPRYAVVAQLVEQRTCNALVAGSRPADGLCRVSSVVEQGFRKAQVAGSSPAPGSRFLLYFRHEAIRIYQTT